MPSAVSRIYQRAGLIAPLQDDGGRAGYHVTGAGYSVLPRDAQAQVAANPGAYRLDDETTGTLLAKPASGVLASPPQAAVDPQEPQQPTGATDPAADQDRVAQAQRAWQVQQQAIMDEFPDVGRPGSAASQTFTRAFARVGNDPRKALAVARAVFGTTSGN